MADTIQSGFANLDETTLAVGDFIPLRDVSDLSMAATGTNKEITVQDFIDFLRTQQLAEYVHATADHTVSSNTTLADANGSGVGGKMAFSVAASAIYAFEFNLLVSAAAATTGLVVAVNGPTIGTGYLRYFYHAPTSATATFHGGAAAYETVLVATGSSATATTPWMNSVTGYLANGTTAGTLTLRIRSEVSAANVTMQRGSWGRLIRVG